MPNNFTLLRVTLAMLVVLGHYRTLPGVPAYGIFSLADFAVDAFFVVSGYLVTGSFDKQPHVSGFYIRRFFRIYPLYLVVLFLQASAMLWLLPNGLYGHLSGFLKYMASNLVFATFMHYDIDGILSGLHNPGINPSLWTLKIEFAFYLILPLIWYLTRRWGILFLVALYLASTLFTVVALDIGSQTMTKQLPAQLRFFVVGIGLYRYGRNWEMPKAVWIIMALMLFWLCAAFRQNLALLPVYPLSIGLLVFIAALRLPAFALRFDISYGIYLIHGPLIQLSLLLGLYRDTVGFLLALISCTILIAFLGDLGIERPGIKLGHRFAPRKRSHSV